MKEEVGMRIQYRTVGVTRTSYVGQRAMDGWMALGWLV
jgi:hypothetical protein